MNNHRILRAALRSTLRSTLVSSRFVIGRSMSAIALVVLFTTAAAFASSTPQGTFDRTLSVSGPVDLEVLTRSGDVTVRAGSSGSVQIHGKIYVGDHWLMGGREADVHQIEQNPPIRQEGNSVHIEYVDMRNISVDYEITVPEETTVRTHSGSGDQTDRRHAWQCRSADRVGRREAHQPYGRDPRADRDRATCGRVRLRAR
jgi:hypothetical protein